MFEGSLVASRGLEGSGPRAGRRSVRSHCNARSLRYCWRFQCAAGVHPHAPGGPAAGRPVLPKTGGSADAVANGCRLVDRAQPACACSRSGQWDALVFTHPGAVEDGPPPVIGPTLPMGPRGPGSMSSLSGIADVGPPAAVARPTRVGPLRISEMSPGMLLTPSSPCTRDRENRWRAGDRRAGGDHLDRQAESRACRSSAAAHAARCRTRCSRSCSLSALQAQRPANRGADHHHRRLPARRMNHTCLNHAVLSVTTTAAASGERASSI